METRFPAADAKDMALYHSMRKKGLINAIELAFASPEEEHRLWIPDQILGAYSDATVGSRSASSWRQEWDVLKNSVSTVRAKL